MEDARRDEPAVLGGRADVVDRLELAGQGLGREVGGLRGGCTSLEHHAARMGVAATDPSASRTSVQGLGACNGVPTRPSRQPMASTTLLIDWARRVPTLRKRISRPASSGIRIRSRSSSGARAVRR